MDVQGKAALQKKMLEKLTREARRPSLVTPLGPGNWPPSLALARLTAEEILQYDQCHRCKLPANPTFSRLATYPKQIADLSCAAVVMDLIDDIDHSIDRRSDCLTVQNDRWKLIYPIYKGQYAPNTPVTGSRQLRLKYKLMKAIMLRFIDLATEPEVATFYKHPYEILTNAE